MKMVLKSVALMAALAVGGAAHAATVYCPNGLGGALVAPTSGRYVKVTNAANPGACEFTEGNWDTQVGPPGNKVPLYESLGYDLLDKNGAPGTYLLNSSGLGGSTSGTWQLAANIWNSADRLFLGMHFGEGGGNPDSFIVELEDGQYSGTWDFLAVAPDRLNGLSNIYLFSKGKKPPPPPYDRLPEPGSLALLGLGLLGLGLVRRRSVR